MATILIVDDYADSRSTLQEFLELHGHGVRTAVDGIQALDQLLHHRVDILVLDIYMPRMDGLEVLRRVRLAHPRVKVIAISGGGEGRHWMPLEVARHLGAHAALSKPLDLDQLGQVITELSGGTQGSLGV